MCVSVWEKERERQWTFLSSIYGGSRPEKRLIMAVNTKGTKACSGGRRAPLCKQSVWINEQTIQHTNKQTNKLQSYLKKLKWEVLFVAWKRRRQKYSQLDVFLSTIFNFMPKENNKCVKNSLFHILQWYARVSGLTVLDCFKLYQF